jgi:hypothetical protein
MEHAGDTKKSRSSEKGKFIAAHLRDFGGAEVRSMLLQGILPHSKAMWGC